MYSNRLVMQSPLGSVAQVWLLRTTNLRLWFRLPSRLPGKSCVKLLVTTTRLILVDFTLTPKIWAALGRVGVPVGIVLGTGSNRKTGLPFSSFDPKGSWLKMPRKPYSAAIWSSDLTPT